MSITSYMKVLEVMHKHPPYILAHAPLKEAVKLIFYLRTGALPILKDKKLAGILTGYDILTHMYPKMEDLIDDSPHTHDFEEMEHNLSTLLETPVSRIMNKKIATTTTFTPLMQAQALMIIHRCSHLPVVNDKKELVGMVSQGDIFRAITKHELTGLKKKKH